MGLPPLLVNELRMLGGGLSAEADHLQLLMFTGKVAGAGIDGFESLIRIPVSPPIPDLADGRNYLVVGCSASQKRLEIMATH